MKKQMMTMTMMMKKSRRLSSFYLPCSGRSSGNGGREGLFCFLGSFPVRFGFGPGEENEKPNQRLDWRECGESDDRVDDGDDGR